MRLLLALGGFAIAVSGCATVQDSSLAFAPGGNESLLISHHDHTIVTLMPVDLDTLTVSGEPVKLGGEFVTMIDYSNERLTEYELEDLKYPKSSGVYLSGFQVSRVNPGTYAITDSFMSSSMAGITNTTQGCFIDEAMVVELSNSNVNYLERPSKMMLRAQFGDAADAMRDPMSPYIAQTKNELDRLKFTLEEYPNIQGEVVHAPIVATIKFERIKKGFLTTTGCDRNETFTVLEGDAL